MSYRKKQVSEAFIRKTGGPTEKSVPGESKPSNITQPVIDQIMASNVTENAGYNLRSLDSQLALSVKEAVSTLSAKNLKTLKGVAYAKRFRGFEDMASKNPQLAVEMLQKHFPDLPLLENGAGSKFSGRSGRSGLSGRSGVPGGSAVSGRSGPPGPPAARPVAPVAQAAPAAKAAPVTPVLRTPQTLNQLIIKKNPVSQTKMKRF